MECFVHIQNLFWPYHMAQNAMVYKFKFIRYGQSKKIALYVPRFNFDGPPKSKKVPSLKSESIEFELNI